MLYGGVTTLLAVEANRVTNILPELDQLSDWGLLVIILAGGTVGLLGARIPLAAVGQWIPAQRFAAVLAGLLAVASAIAGSITLVLYCVTVLGVQAVWAMVCHD